MTIADRPDFGIFLERGGPSGQGKLQRFLKTLEVGAPVPCSGYSRNALRRSAKYLGIPVAIRTINGEPWIARLS